MLQSYQDVTFPKHILQSKEPNTNSQVQVLLKLPRYKTGKTGSVQNVPECCSFRSVWAGHTDFIENRYCKMAWKIGNSMKECMTFSLEFWTLLMFITVFIDWIIKLFREIRSRKNLWHVDFTAISTCFCWQQSLKTWLKKSCSGTTILN